MREEGPERTTLTVQEAARLLGVGRNTLYAQVLRGDVPSLLIRRRRLIPKDALDAWVRAQVDRTRAEAQRR